MIVDNRPGAAGILAAQEVARAAADGLTLLWAYNAVITINPVVRAKLPYDPAKDFVPVVQVNKGAYILVTPTGLAASNVNELIAEAKRRPGSLNYGSYGAGGGSHLAAELFNRMAGVNIVHVPFKSGAVNEVIAGRIELLFEPAAGALPHIKGGKVKALAVSGSTRIAGLPDVPTVAESLPGFDVDSWQGLFAPAGTPAAVIERLNADVLRISATPEMIQRLGALGFTAAAGSPSDFAQLVRDKSARWSKLVREIDLKPE